MRAGTARGASSGALAGRRIVVTRPAGQADRLANLILEQDGESVVFPVLEIRDVEDVAPLLALVDRLDEFDLAVFISPNAVNKAMNLIVARRAWPASVRAATIGRESEKQLRRYGVGDVIAPPGRSDSESLLALAELQSMAGQRVVIFRGDGGRELLAETLVARGAKVEYAECYRRVRPCADIGPLIAAWARNEVDAVVVTSSEGLGNLIEMLGEAGAAYLRGTPVVVPHPRIAERARARGLERIVLTNPGDKGIAAGLAAFFATL